MYIKVKSYRIIWNYRELAIVKMEINLFTMKLKAIIKLSNNEEYIVYSDGETNEDFQKRVEIFVHSKSNL
ncbi:hypothetical protein [Flavobacterium macrobrachii]|uniref:hypothetical protein n=1 Tax=Flavobacterium macrobrachii TaxID=591204 RepID=UPI003F6EF337